MRTCKGEIINTAAYMVCRFELYRLITQLSCLYRLVLLFGPTVRRGEGAEKYTPMAIGEEDVSLSLNSIQFKGFISMGNIC